MEHKCTVYADDADVFEKALMSFRKTQRKERICSYLITRINKNKSFEEVSKFRHLRIMTL